MKYSGVAAILFTLSTYSLAQTCDAPMGVNQNGACVTTTLCSQNTLRATCNPLEPPNGLGKEVCGAWTVPQNICQGDPHTVKCVGVHTALLSTGNVLFWYETGTDNPTNNSFVLSNLSNCPGNCTLTNTSAPFPVDNILCAGMSVGQSTPGGTPNVVIATGGMVENTPPDGINKTSFFTPSGSGGTWTAGPLMANPRFYPSNVQLNDGKTLVVSGTSTGNQLVLQMEKFDGAAWSATTPDILNDSNIYPRVKLMPSSQFVMAGPGKQTYIYDPRINPALWRTAGVTTFGALRSLGGVALLPLDPSPAFAPKIFTAGGNTSGEGAGCNTNTSETYNVSTQSWTAESQCMCYARFSHNLVILADGTLLAVGGGKGANYNDPVKAPERYDPNNSTNKWSVLASQQANRTYHSTAILLPDGRVLSAGSDVLSGHPTEVNPLDNTFEIFSPPYLFVAGGGAAPRPVMSSVTPTTVGYNQNFTITVPAGTSVSTVAFVRPGATTHAYDTEQRYVKLVFTRVNNTTLSVTAPANGNRAAPGFYMLFIVNSSGVPSVSGTSTISPAPFMRLQ